MSCLYCAIALKNEVENVVVRRTKLTYIFGSHRSGDFVVHPSLHECIKAVASILLSFYKLVYNFAETVLRYFGLPVDSGGL